MYRTADQSTVNIYESKCCSCSKSCRIGNSDHMDVRPVVYVVLKKINFFFQKMLMWIKGNDMLLVPILFGYILLKNCASSENKKSFTIVIIIRFSIHIL